MGDYDLTWPGPRRPSLLGDYHLHLDPQIEAEIRATEARQTFERLREVWLRPDWWQLERILPQQPPWLQMRPPAPAAPLVPRGAGPATPRPGAISDVLKAIWAVPAVQSAADRVLDQATSNLRLGWRDASTGERVLVVGHAVLMVGTLVPLLTVPRYRQEAFDLIQGHDIPVPFVRGGWVRVVPRGGFAGVGIPWMPGSSVSGGLQLGNETSPTNWNVQISIDVAQLLRRRR
jgi:hypothetical protein